MAMLRGFKDATVQETQHRADRCLSGGHALVDHFCAARPDYDRLLERFPFWTSFWICALGGILGVMYSIPLRRALVTQSDLPYPEGVACR